MVAIFLYFFIKDFLLCPQMLMHATPHRVSSLVFYTVNHCGYVRVNAHRGCMNTVRESALQAKGKKSLLKWGIKPADTGLIPHFNRGLHVAFQSTALAAVIPPLATLTHFELNCSLSISLVLFFIILCCLYWAIQAGLLTPLTFARHRLSPLAAFTSGAYFLHNGRR